MTFNPALTESYDKFREFIRLCYIASLCNMTVDEFVAIQPASTPKLRKQACNDNWLFQFECDTIGALLTVDGPLDEQLRQHIGRWFNERVNPDNRRVKR